MSRKNPNYLRQFIGDYNAPPTSTLRRDYRKIHGNPTRPNAEKYEPIQAQPAPKDWRTDKTARAMGKVRNA